MNESLVQEKKVSDIAHRQIMAALREIFSDPDRGLTPKKSFVSRITKSVHSKEAGKVKNLKEVLAKYGVA